MRAEAPIGNVTARAFKIPTDKPEADGTFAWDATTMVVVEAGAGGKTGIGYTYSDASICSLVTGVLAKAIDGVDAFDTSRAWAGMQSAVRNLGRGGLVASAISAVDAALWDLKAKLLDLPLVMLLGRIRDCVPIYGSGGFTTYDDEELRTQLSNWVTQDGCGAVKMKIGTRPDEDPHRITVAPPGIDDAGLFIDANGAFSVRSALHMAEVIADQHVSWFEEPVTSDDLDGLAIVRRMSSGEMDVAAGEYGYTLDYFARMLAAGAVDCQQADLTRCGGVTGFLRVAALCETHHIDLSAHCAPALHRHAACAAPRLRHLEWFHDHVRIEQMLFDGAPTATAGTIRPDLSRAGHGLALREKDAARYAL